MVEKMEGVEAEPQVNGVSKPVNDFTAIIANFPLLESAVSQFDARFTLRALRSISSFRKDLTVRKICEAAIWLHGGPAARPFFDATGESPAGMEKWLAEQEKKEELKPYKIKSPSTLPETDVFLGVVLQVYFYEHQEYQKGAQWSTALVDKIRELNRRTLDSLAAKAYFYLELFYEQLEPRAPSKQSPLVSIRVKLHAALRSAVLRKDEETQAAAIILLLRNYIATADIDQADHLIQLTKFPSTAPNNQVARYLYYVGRIRAIQLSYTEAHSHLTSATRKCPSSSVAIGFYQASHKFLVVVELLMGDIPDRSIFSQPKLERALEPYFKIVQAVRKGDLQNFLRIAQTYAENFRNDGTYTLVMRLRQNVIRTGIRMLSLSYSRISLRDICIRLGLESEESAEYIVAKAIRDGVIEASINHERGYMETRKPGDVYATREPAEAFHERIQACLSLHDESVKAMRFPMNRHRLELKSAQEARERERELAKEIQEGDIDEDDAGGDFEGL